jgi:hypothetical protein
MVAACQLRITVDRALPESVGAGVGVPNGSDCTTGDITKGYIMQHAGATEETIHRHDIPIHTLQPAARLQTLIVNIPANNLKAVPPCVCDQSAQAQQAKRAQPGPAAWACQSRPSGSPHACHACHACTTGHWYAHHDAAPSVCCSPPDAAGQQPQRAAHPGSSRPLHHPFRQVHTEASSSSAAPPAACTTTSTATTLCSA